MPIAISSLVRVNWLGRCFGQRIILTTAYQKVTGPAALSEEDELNQVLDELVVGGTVDVLTAYMSCLPASYSMETLIAQEVFPIRTTAVQRIVVTPGTHASPATVANDSACITLKGRFAGSNKRSNKHIGPVPDAASASGLLTNGYKAILANMAAKLLANFVLPAGETYLPVVFRIINPASAPAFELTMSSVGPQSRVQRRRTVGLGE